jgi:outer membrane protein assembly factor BamB
MASSLMLKSSVLYIFYRGLSMYGIFHRVGVTLLLLMMFVIGIPGQSSADTNVKSFDNYKQVWSLSTGTSPYAATPQILEVRMDGSVLYGLANTDGHFFEIGLRNASGKILWKRSDVYIYEYRLNQSYVVALAFTPTKDYRQDSILVIRKSDGKIVKNFSLEPYGIIITPYNVFELDQQNRIYIPVDNRLLALDVTGRKLWELRSDNPNVAYHRPIILDGERLVTWTDCSGYGVCSEDMYRFMMLSTRTGQAYWAINQHVNTDFPIVQKDRIIVENSSGCFAFRLDSGELLWRFHENGSLEPEGIDPEGRIYISEIEPDHQGHAITRKVLSLDRNGALLWSTHINLPSFTIRGVSVNGKIVYADSDYGVYYMDRVSGKILASIPYYRAPGSKVPTGPIAKSFGNSLLFTEEWYQSKGDWFRTMWNVRLQVYTKLGKKVGGITFTNRGPVYDAYVGPDFRLYVTDSHSIKAFAPVTMK